MLPEENAALRTKVMCRLARELHWAADPERAAVLAKAALESARKLGDPSSIAQALSVRHVTCQQSPSVAERSQFAMEGIRLAEEIGDMELILEARVGQLRDSLVSGNIEDFRSGIEEYGRVAETLRQPINMYYARVVRSVLDIMQGRFAEAETCIQEAVEANRGIPGSAAMRFAATGLSGLAQLRGDPTAALQAIEDPRWWVEGWSTHGAAAAQGNLRRPDERSKRAESWKV
jgi:hypothetical protein